MNTEGHPARRHAAALAIAVTALAAVPAAAQPETGNAATSAEPALDPAMMEALDWRSIGPANMGGRIIDIEVYEADPTIWYIASASGGLLKTTNKGVTFEHQFDHENTVSIGDVAVFAGDPDIVWVGTGENNPRNSVSWGDGVYRSEDGGETWQHAGLEETFTTGDLLIHPDDPDTVFVGAMGRVWGPNEQRGVFKTTDGGETWQHVLFVDERTGVIDLAMHPENPDIMLAAAWERQRDEFDTNDPAKRWGPGSGLYRSTDGGETWREITDGLPTVDMGRIGIEWSRSNPAHVYMLVDTVRIGEGIPNAGYLGVSGRDADAGARITRVVDDGPGAAAGLEPDDVVIAVDGDRVVRYDDLLSEIRVRTAGTTATLTVVRDGEIIELEAELGEPEDPDAKPFSRDLGGQRDSIQDQQGDDGHETGGLFMSEDAGRTWNRINSINPRPMYFSKLFIDPSDENYQWIAGIPLSKSEDGGETWTRDGTPGIVHVDHHAMWIDPDDGRHLLLGNDGGLYESFDRGETWRHLNTAVISQFYHVNVDSQPFYNVYGGLQDNGSWGGPNASRDGGGVGNTDWFRIGGGDGFICYADGADPDQLYYASQNGGVARVHLRTGERRGLRPREPRGTDYRWNWKTPFMLSHHNPEVYYLAGNFVFRSLHKGDNLKRISPEITRTRRGSASGFDESPLDPDILYVGSDDGAVWVTRDGGITWQNLLYPFDPEAYPEEEDEQPVAARGNGRQAPATATGDPIAGVWTGRIDGSDDTFTLTIRRGDDGDLAASLVSSAASGNASRLSFDADRDALVMSVPSDIGVITLTATLADGILAGEARIDQLEFAAAFTAVRQAAERPARRDRARNQRRQRDTADSPGRTGRVVSMAALDPNTPEPPAFDPDDPIVGAFRGETVGEGGGSAVFIELTRGDDGELLVYMDSTFFNAEARAETFDPGTGELRFDIQPEVGDVEVTATLDGDTLRGRFGVPDFDFTRDFELTRETAGGDGDGRSLAELVPAPRRVTSIEASRFERERVYMTMAGYYYDDDAPYVFVSDDAGRTWRSLADGLPDASTRVIREDLENPDVLWLGTEFALHVSVDRGRTWTKVSNNSDLPTVAIHEIAQHDWSGDLIAGTHGRGIWILNPAPIRQMTREALAADAWLFEPARVVRWRQDASRGRGASDWFTGDDPDRDAHIYYKLASEAPDLEIEIRDVRDRLVRRFDVDGSRTGLRRLDWNLRREPTGRQRFGALVDPGTYRVVMRAGDIEISRELEIVTDPEMNGEVFATEQFNTEAYVDLEEEAASADR